VVHAEPLRDALCDGFNGSVEALVVGRVIEYPPHGVPGFRGDSADRRAAQEDVTVFPLAGCDNPVVEHHTVTCSRCRGIQGILVHHPARSYVKAYSTIIFGHTLWVVQQSERKAGVSARPFDGATNHSAGPGTNTAPGLPAETTFEYRRLRVPFGKERG